MKSITCHTWIIAAALYAAVALIFLAPVLLRDDVVIYGLDTLTEEYPMYWWGWTQVKETGQIPWWCPHLFGGYPFVASFSFCPFYPPQWLSLLMDFPAAYNWQFFLVLWMAGCCGYAGLRLAGWPRGLALAGGLLWMTCGHVVTLIYPGHLKKMQALVWVPLAWGGVAGALRAMANPDLRPELKSKNVLARVAYFFRHPVGLFTIAGAAMAMQLLAHHFQIFYFSMMMVGLYWLWMVAIGEGDKNFPVGHKRGVIFSGGLFGLLGIGLVAVGLSAIQMFPSMHMAAMSNRAGGVSFEEATITSYPPEELLEFALPQFWGDSARRQQLSSWQDDNSGRYRLSDWMAWILPNGGSDLPREAAGVYLGRWNNQKPERLVSDYIGIVVILLACLGLTVSQRRERWFWLGLIILIAAISFGSYTPFFSIVWKFVPMMDRFRSPGTSMFVISWGVILLALMGLESLSKLATASKSSMNLVYSVLSVLIVSLVSLIIYALIASQVLSILNFANDRDLQIKSVGVILKSISFGRVFLISLISSTIIVALYPLWLDKYWKAKVVHLLIAGLLVIQMIDMWDHTRAFIQPEPYTQGYARYLFDTAPDNYLAAQPQPFRMIQYNNELATRFLARGLNSTHGLHPITFQKYFNILDRSWFYDPLFIHMFNQQYVIAREGEALPDGYIQAAKGGGYQVGKYGDHLRHVWIARDIKTYNNNEDAFQKLKTLVENKTFYDEACFSSWDYALAELAIIQFDMKFDHPGRATDFEAKVTQFDPGEIVIHTKGSAAAWLIVSEHAAPGWRAELDNGQIVRPITANYFFQMYPAPEGEHVYRLTYSQPWARTGAAITFITMLAIFWVAIRMTRSTAFVKEAQAI